MKRLMPYLTVFVILALVAVYIFMYKQETSLRRKNLLHLNDTAAITAFTLAGHKDTTVLTKKEASWYVNEHIAANQEKVQIMVDALHRMQVKSVIREKQPPTGNKGDASAVHLHIRYADGREKQWVAGDTVRQLSATKFRLPGKPNTIYLMHVPVYDLQLKSVLQTNPFYWRNKQILAAKPENISKVKVMYRDRPGKGFALICRADTCFLRQSGQEVNKDAVRRYLSYFNDHVQFQREAAPGEVNADTLMQKQPAITLILEQKPGKSDTLAVFRKPAAAGDKPFDLNQAYAVLNNRPEVWLVRYYDIDPWLKERAYFLMKQ